MLTGESTFEIGIDYKLSDYILLLNGIGRIDHEENTLIGIKSCEVYKVPGATIYLKAHKELENLTLIKHIVHFKPTVSKNLTEFIYDR